MAGTVMCFVHDCPKEAGRLVSLVINDVQGFYLAPDNDHPLDALKVSDLRPFPAFDAMHWLGGLCGGWPALSMWNQALDREARHRLPQRPD